MQVRARESLIIVSYGLLTAGRPAARPAAHHAAHHAAHLLHTMLRTLIRTLLRTLLRAAARHAAARHTLPLATLLLAMLLLDTLLELELELIQSHMAQKLELRGKVGACRFTQLTSTAKRQRSVQVVERPLNAKVGVPPSIGSLAASRAAGALAALPLIAPFSSL